MEDPENLRTTESYISSLQQILQQSPFAYDFFNCSNSPLTEDQPIQSQRRRVEALRVEPLRGSEVVFQPSANPNFQGKTFAAPADPFPLSKPPNEPRSDRHIGGSDSRIGGVRASDPSKSPLSGFIRGPENDNLVSMNSEPSPIDLAAAHYKHHMNSRKLIKNIFKTIHSPAPGTDKVRMADEIGLSADQPYRGSFIPSKKTSVVSSHKDMSRILDLSSSQIHRGDLSTSNIHNTDHSSLHRRGNLSTTQPFIPSTPQRLNPQRLNPSTTQPLNRSTSPTPKPPFRAGTPHTQSSKQVYRESPSPLSKPYTSQKIIEVDLQQLVSSRPPPRPTELPYKDLSTTSSKTSKHSLTKPKDTELMKREIKESMAKSAQGFLYQRGLDAYRNSYLG